jgi:S1-C subfamily serine protease
MSDHRLPLRSVTAPALLALAVGALVVVRWASAFEIDPRVLEAEKARIATVAKVQPTVVAVLIGGGTNGGSGVLIDKEGYALTNFHVVREAGPTMKCGLADGILYDAVLVGLDKVGDVALIKLLPKKEGDEFPFAKLGDSDKVQAGDWSLAMGNPFLLATDFKPTVTYGLVSGVHRYQYPEGGLLEYTDCIQIDTSINPGNSGGPLFNMAGELIGINGRGSFDKRSRINSGVGYAISINQIKNFLGQLYAGIDTDHASLFTVQTDKDEVAKVVVSQITESSDVYRRGIRSDDQILEFGGRPIGTTNQFKNILGTFPRGWRVPLTYRHDAKKNEVLVRLAGYQARELDDNNKPKEVEGGGAPKAATGPAAKFYEAKPGLANNYFNKQRKERLLAALRMSSDMSQELGTWTIEANVDSPKRKGAPATIVLSEEKEEKVKGTHTIIKLNLDGLKYTLDPLKDQREELKREEMVQPTGSGGLLLALYNYRQLLTAGEKGFVGSFQHGGVEPVYPPKVDGPRPAHLRDLRVDAEVLNTDHAGAPGKWYFSPTDLKLIGFEVTANADQDPCQVFLSDYKAVNGKQLPHRIEVWHGSEQYGVFTVKSYQFAKAQ